MNNLLIKKGLLLFILLTVSSCASTDKRETPEDLKMRLNNLQGGMTIQEAVQVLGTPTSLTEIKLAESVEPYYEVLYVNTIINPGVVELFFEPLLTEIRVDTILYRDFTRSKLE